MAEPAFDTLTIAKELERDYGFEAKQAEGAAVMIHRHLVGNVATKDDLKAQSRELTGKIEAQGRELSGKIVALDEKIEAQGRELSGKIVALDEKIEAQGRELSGKIVALDEKIGAQDGKIATLATKEEMVQLEDRVIMKMTIRLGGIMIGALAFFEVLNRVFPIAGG